MKFSPEDLYTPNGIFAKGQRLVILGPPELGKSRLLLQMALCALTGRDFIGWPMRKLKGKWMMLQTQNSNRRLHADLSAIRKGMKGEEWKIVNEKLIIHTVEEEHDGFLNLDNPDVANLVAAFIKEDGAEVVSFDQLNEFTALNLNSDAAMLHTCRAMERLAKQGNPSAAALIVHHAHADIKGMKKAVGIERGMYGRNSRALYTWTRGAINLAPGVEKGKLVVACGKNSDYPDFETFGIALNPATMTYEVDDTFDLEEWLATLAGETPAAKHKPNRRISQYS